MKVELDLDASQLELLDKNLKDCLLSLSKEQQVELLQNYVNTQLEGFRQVKHKDGYYYNTEYEYTDFGKQLVDTLRTNVEEAITASILNRDDIETLIQDKIVEVSKRIDTIIENAITKYVIEHLFVDKGSIENEIRNTIYKMRCENNR